MYSCHLSTSSASVGSLLFLSFIVPILAQNVPLISPVFLKWYLFFPSLLFSFISCISNRSSYLSLLFCGTLHSVECTFPCLPCLSLLFSAICKASSGNHFAFFHFSFLGMVLVTVSCTVLWTSVHSSSGAPYTRSNPLNLFITSTMTIWFNWFTTIKSVNCKGSDLGHTCMA